MKQTISFDLWKTLIKSNAKCKNEQAKVFANYTLNTNIDYVQNVIREVDIFYTKSDEITGSQTHSEKIILLVLRELNIDINSISDTLIQDLQQKINNLYMEYHPELYDEHTKSMLEQLSKDYKLVVASNTGFIKGAKMREILHKLDIGKYFDEVYFSDEIEQCKPHPHFFNTILCENPDYIIHVGDSLTADLKGVNDFNKIMLHRHSIKPFIINSNENKINHLPDFIKSLSASDIGQIQSTV
jgi:putative hydrolase of the HAD superfamily